jgi:hypothetical protein
MKRRSHLFSIFLLCGLLLFATSAFAAPLSFTVNMSEAVNVNTVGGVPRIAVNVGGVTRYASYASGTGTSALTFTYTPQAGDLDLDGVTVSSPVDLNGGTIADLNGNAITDLTFTPPNTANVKVDYPSLSMDFIAGDYILSGTHYATLPSFLTAAGGSFTRNSVGTYFDSAGVMQTAAAHTPRFDYDPVTLQPKGLLIEEQRTNQVKNAEFQGAAIGVTPPNISIGGGAGVSASVTGVGTLNGENYIEVTFSGTSSSASTIWPNINLASNVVATQGQSWTARARIISDTGTSPNAPYLELAELDASNAYLVASSTSTTVGGLRTISRTLTNASTAKLRFLYIASAVAPGQAINRTVRISVPQLEQGAFATSYIPTTAAAVTRQADNIVVPTGAWYNQSAGTFYEDVSWLTAAGTGYPMFWRVDDTTSNNRWNAYYSQASGNRGVDGYNTSVAQGFFPHATATSGTGKIASAQALNNTNAAYDGTLKTLDTTWTPPTVTRFFLGQSAGAIRWDRQIKYYPARVTDAQLQLLTQ